MDRVRIYIPTESIEPGEVVAVFGPSRGAVDWDAPLVLGRVVAQRGSGRVGRRSLPDGAQPLGLEARGVVVLSPPLAFGRYYFGVEVLDAESGARDVASRQTVSVFVNGTPRPATRFARVSGAELSFAFTASEDVG